MNFQWARKLSFGVIADRLLFGLRYRPIDLFVTLAYLSNFSHPGIDSLISLNSRVPAGTNCMLGNTSLSVGIPPSKLINH